MTIEKPNAPTDGAGARAEVGSSSHYHITHSTATQALAVHNLARLLAGATDADRNLLIEAFPDLPMDGGSPKVERSRLREYLKHHPGLLEAVLRQDPDSPPQTTQRAAISTDCPPLPSYARLDSNLGAGAGQWVDTYVTYATAVSPMTPQRFHVSAGLTLVSIAVARRLVVPMAFAHVYPNLYSIWLAPTTLFRKTTSLDIARVMAADVFPHLLAAQDTTPEALLSDMAGQEPANLQDLSAADREEWARARNFSAQRGWFLDEMSGLLAAAGRDYNAGLIEALLRFYDCDRRYTRSTRGQGRLVIHNSYMSLLGASTPAAMSSHLLSERLWSMGWWPRFVILTPDTERPEWREPREMSRPSALENGLRHLYQQLPEANYPEPPHALTVTLGSAVHAAWNQYNRAMSYELLTNEVDHRLWGSYGRLPVQVLKVSTLLAAMDWPDGQSVPRIELPHLARAIAICEDWRASAHRALMMVDKTEFGGLRKRILRQIGQSEPAGATARDVYRSMRDVSPDEIKRVLQQLMDVEDVRSEEVKPEGRGRGTVRYHVSEGSG